MRRLTISILILCGTLILTACQPSTQPPTPIPMSAAVAVNNTVIRWVRSPEEVVFRIDVSGGASESTIIGKREVPLCTVYGDNRVVWVNELGAFNIEVLYDRISDELLADFLVWMTVNQRVYTYQTPEESEDGAVIESVVINVNGIRHEANGFSGWDEEWFNSTLYACRLLSNSPVLFAPDGAWLTVEPAVSDRQAPSMQWDMFDVIDLSARANAEPVWITGAVMMRLWRLQLTQPSRFQLVQDSENYAIALQVPGITRTSPPAPR